MTPLRYYDVNDRQTPRQQYREDLQATINEIFESSATIYTLEQEENPGTQEYTNLDVRLVQAINSETGQKLGDDFRKVIFKDQSSNPVMGKRYRFEDNVWLTVNTDNYAHYSFNSTLARCHTTMNWYLENGTIHKEPVVLNYNLKNTKFMVKKLIDAKQGDVSGVVQANSFTNSIDINDTFIFGSGKGLQKYKVTAVYSALAQETFDNSQKLIKFDFMVYNENLDEDNINERVSNPIPNYSIEIDQGDISQLQGYQTTLTSTVKNDDDIVDRGVLWSTSEDTIVSVSNAGEINLLQSGSAVITAKLDGNDQISDSITVNVVPSLSNNFEVRISPEEESILQGNSQSYSVYLYNNNIQQPDTFVVTASGVPNDNYKLNIVDGNNFVVENIFQYDDSKLSVTCQSGVHQKTIMITIGGVW